MDQLLRGCGVTDPRVIGAVLAVPRELFVSGSADEQSVPQACAVALQLERLRLHPIDRVLHIGTGSGYPAAVLSLLVAEVFTLDPDPARAAAARERLAAFGYSRITVGIGDGARGWPKHGPYDAVVVTDAKEPS